MRFFRVNPLALAVCALATPLACAQAQPDSEPPQDEYGLPPLVVTAPAMSAPLEVTFDPRAPQQPLPANDGASLLKSIPGMGVVRKGGTDGDPVFRGMAASRLNILIDGEQILGGCGGRMDPPTAYIFPDAYTRVTLLKGPQSVRYGAGASAGTVLFEREPAYFAEPGWNAQGALTLGSFSRRDGFVDVKGGNSNGYMQLIATSAESDDYEDGNGDRVHSRYERRSATLALGWTPDRDTRLILTGIHSEARAAYADRGMDGSVFDRDNLGLKFEKENMDGLVHKIEAQVFWNYIDHVMDNYSLRDVGSSTPSAGNPDRQTTGLRMAATLRPGEHSELVLGLDQQGNRHRSRSGSGTSPYYLQPRVANLRFSSLGLFGEYTQFIGDAQRVISGLRVDSWQARDRRASAASQPNPTAGQKRERYLPAAFARYEHDLWNSAATIYAGLGHNQRAPDFWELVKEAAGQDNASTASAFSSLRPEKLTQLDAGLNWRGANASAFLSAFYGKVDDYILIQSNYSKPALSGSGTRTTTVARNVDATLYGAETGFDITLARQWKASSSLAWTHATNDTDHRPLGQTPPLELRLGLDWEHGDWTVGSLLRLVRKQNRYALYEGNIVGQDMGPAPGFGVFSLNGAWRINPHTRLAFGVDNLFDKTYAEFISKGGTDISGYEQTLRVNEPGRTFWLKAQFEI